MAANKENYGRFYSLFFSFSVTAYTEKYTVLKTVAVLVKWQISPDGEEENSSSWLKIILAFEKPYRLRRGRSLAEAYVMAEKGVNGYILTS